MRLNSFTAIFETTRDRNENPIEFCDCPYVNDTALRKIRHDTEEPCCEVNLTHIIPANSAYMAYMFYRLPATRCHMQVKHRT